MNRKQRRARQASEFKIQPHGSYDEMVTEVGPDGAAMMMLILRLSVQGIEQADQWSDRELFAAQMGLITNGYLDLFVTWTDDEISVRPELKMPGFGTFEDYCRATAGGLQ